MGILEENRIFRACIACRPEGKGDLLVQDLESGFYGLIRRDHYAQSFYNALPNYVQQAVCQNAANITSYDQLRAFAGRLLCH